MVLAESFRKVRHSLGRFFLFGKKDLTIIRDPFVPMGARPGGRGDGLDSNVVMAPVMWIMRTFTEAEAVVQRWVRAQQWEALEDHALMRLIDRPNEGYDGDTLWKATVVSYAIDGNAYWRKVRNAFGEVIALWYVPHWMMHPRWPTDGTTFISHYDYHSGLGGAERLLPRDVVHFRFGLDPENTRLGLSPLKTLLRDVHSDDLAAQFTQKILKNMGVPGLVVSPKNESFKPDKDEVEKLRDYLKVAFSGENRGDPMVLGVPTEVSQFGFDPNKLMLANLRDISEERVCAAIGIPAAVVGFGAGLQSTKVGATMRELRKLAWIQCLTPMQKTLAKQATAQLLPDFVSQTRRFRVAFDLSGVSAFQEEDDLSATRVARLVQGGILRVDRAQALLGLEVDETQQVYLRPSNSLLVDPTDPEPPAAASEEDDEEGAPPNENADEEEDDTKQLLRAIKARVHTNGHAGRHTP